MYNSIQISRPACTTQLHTKHYGMGDVTRSLRHAHFANGTSAATSIECEEVRDGRLTRRQRFQDILRKHPPHDRTDR